MGPESARDATRRQVWQTADGLTKADAKAERAQLVARVRLGHRVERTSLIVGQVARQWVQRDIGPRGPWEPSTRERYERVVRRFIEGSADPTRRPLGDLKLRDATSPPTASPRGPTPSPVPQPIARPRLRNVARRAMTRARRETAGALAAR